MNRTDKTESLELIKDSFSRAQAVIFADYKGVTSEEMNSLRRSMRGKNVRLAILKNNLIRVALKGSAKSDALEKLSGPTLASFAFGDPVELAKGLTDFAKKVEAFSLKDGFLGDKVVSEAQIKELATLPSKEVLVAQLLSVLQGPMRNFLGVLNAAQRDVTRVLQAVADKKGQAG